MLVHILQTFGITTFHPFILYMLKHYEYDKKKLDSVFYELERFVMKRVIAKEETRSFNKIVKEFIDNPDSVGEKATAIDWSKVSNGLRAISNKNASLLLFWIELFKISAPKNAVRELRYDYSLEHIMPQKWQEFWVQFPIKYNPDGTEMSVDQAAKDRGEKVYWIGNMTLLTSPLNAALRNHNIEDKIEGKNGKKGMRAYSSLLITREFIEEFDNGDKKWDELKINKRTEKLEEVIRKMWA